MRFLEGIAQGAPVWVWPLLVVLIVVGAYSTRTRTGSIVVYYFYPFFGLLSVNSILGLPLPGAAWLGFVGGVIAGVFFGFWVQQKWIIAKTDRRVSVHGEYLTLTALMAIFWSNFVAGTVLAINPALYSQTFFVLGLSAVIGLASGTFVGRSICVIVARKTGAIIQG